MIVLPLLLEPGRTISVTASLSTAALLLIVTFLGERRLELASVFHTRVALSLSLVLSAARRNVQRRLRSELVRGIYAEARVLRVSSISPRRRE